MTKAARDYDNIPTIENAVEFGNAWLTWWNKMQPKWRRVNAENSLPLDVNGASEANQNLSSLKRAGPSGLVTVMIGLKWWGTAANQNKGWHDAVSDVVSCFKFILDGNEQGKGKRKAMAATQATSKRRRKC